MDNTTPYHEAAVSYLMSGWNILVLPLGQKFPPPAGTTGVGGMDVDEEVSLIDWMEEGGNIGLRMGEDMIGIDVDGIAGYGVFKALEKKLGALPIEYIVSSHRSHSEGFTAFFKVPVGTAFKGHAGANIDIIQHNHRYQVVAPSVHPTGRVYEWRTWVGGNTVPFIPEASDLPPLPSPWVEYLKKEGSVSPSPVEAHSTPSPSPVEDYPTLSPEELNAALEGEGCSLMNKITGTRIKALRSPKSSRHDAMVLAVWAIVSEAHKGHTGGQDALDRYKRAWLAKFTPSEATERDLNAEFRSSVLGAQAKQEGSEKGTCACGGGRGAYAKNKNRSIVTGQRMWR